MDKASDSDFSVSNEELLELCKQQDQEALRVLLRRHERPVYGLLFRMLSNHEDAEEALAEVFVKVWRGAASFKGDAKFTTWLFRIAANTARDALRTRKTRHEVSMEDTVIDEVEATEQRSADGDPERQTINIMEKERIVGAMQSLPEDDRLLIDLYHFQERDYDEIAQIMDLPAGNLKVKLFRARQRLKKVLAEQEKDENENEMRRSSTRSSGLQPGPAESL